MRDEKQKKDAAPESKAAEIENKAPAKAGQEALDAQKESPAPPPGKAAAEEAGEAFAGVELVREKPAEPAEEAAREDAPPAREKNYVSAVVYLGDEKGCAAPFLKALCGALAERFERYELVFVDDASRDGTAGEVRRCLETMDEKPPVTLIHMSLRQGLELAMNAGLDMAVGDFVWEFDSMRMPWPPELILQAYDACLAGSDIVSAAPRKNRNLTSRLFYRLFNGASHSRYPLRTDVFRLLSRRAINRVRGMTATMPYRKAAYAACGLKMETLVFDGPAAASTEQMRFSRAVDSLALYTDIASRAAMGIAMLMLALMLAAVVYTVVVWTGVVVAPAPGWTTTMLMLSGGFFGVFLILAFVLKYLGLLMDLIFRKQTYLVESIEKLN